MRKISILALSLALCSTAFAEEAKKPLSPPAKAEAKFGSKSITIDYNAPSKRGRTIMGELVPYGKLWRTGANAATTLKTDANLMIGSLHVPAGTYTLFTIPAQNEWTLVVSKQTGLWGTKGYDETQDLGRVKLAVEPVQETAETFAIAVTPSGANRGTLSFTWENTRATAPVMVH